MIEKLSGSISSRSVVWPSAFRRVVFTSGREENSLYKPRRTPILPDPKLTPSDTFDATAQDVRVPGYAHSSTGIDSIFIVDLCWLYRGTKLSCSFQQLPGGAVTLEFGRRVAELQQKYRRK